MEGEFQKIDSILLIFLIFSLVINLVFFYFEILPYLFARIRKPNGQKNISLNSVVAEQIIVEKAIEMCSSDEVTMVWNEKSANLIEHLISIKKERRQTIFKKFSYPRAFLLAGLTQYACDKNDLALIKTLQSVFDKYIDKNGNPIFKIERVDQVPFGIAAINLFNFSKEIKYKTFAEIIYSNLLNFRNKENNLIYYRANSTVQFNDVLGMICPFLTRYAILADNEEASLLCKQQLQYFIKFGVDKETWLPCHGINIESGLKVGSINWGRGIGWYMIGLAEYNKHFGGFDYELDNLILTLDKLKLKDNTWSQFPGSSTHFDASSTTMFMYAIKLKSQNTISNLDLINILKTYINQEGVITSTSGDTYGINRYSNTFGNSELSQGMLLFLLSQTN